MRSVAAALALTATSQVACGHHHSEPPTARAIATAPTVDVSRDQVAIEPASQVLVVGQAAPPIAPTARPVGPVAIVPALPAGLVLDAASGAISGTPRAASAGRLYQLDLLGQAIGAVWLEVVPAPGSGPDDRVVSLGGDDGGDGSIARPFATVARALRGARPGTTVWLRAGTYRTPVALRGLHGAPGQPIALRGFPGETVVIDPSDAELAEHPATAWQRATEPGAHPDEWVSTRTYPTAMVEGFSRGAFVSEPYTRLLTYARLEDLRAANERWDWLDAADPRPGPVVLARQRVNPHRPVGARRPWTYFGPGLWFDHATGRIHLRLSPTHNDVAGLADYAGPSDPRQVPLALSRYGDVALRVAGSTEIAISHLTIRNGGNKTAIIQGSGHVALDHVEIDGSTYGLSIILSDGVAITHARLDGGMPTWSFRSDFKDVYELDDGVAGPVRNRLVSQTSRALLYVGPKVTHLELAYCDLENGHDLYLAGRGAEIHHDRIHRIHDDALVLNHTDDIDDFRFHDNVVEQTLTGLSFAGGRTGGSRYLYRNLFDLRTPTAGYRPDSAGRSVWRYGHLFKAKRPLGPFFFYQNTAIISHPEGQAAFMHFRVLEKDGQPAAPRWFLNNLFVALAPDPATAIPMAVVPGASFLAARGADGLPVLRSDGNVWVRGDGSSHPLFRCIAEAATTCAAPQFATLAAVRAVTGFDQHSRATADPGLERDLGQPTTIGGFRPRPDSAARDVGVALPATLPGASELAGRDAGAFARSAPTLRVGPDGMYAY